jgi:hypothetical protein
MHLFERYGGPPGFDDPAQNRSRPFRQEHNGTIGMEKKLHPVARLQPEMLPDRLWDRRLAFRGDRSFHSVRPITFSEM